MLYTTLYHGRTWQNSRSIHNYIDNKMSKPPKVHKHIKKVHNQKFINILNISKHGSVFGFLQLWSQSSITTIEEEEKKKRKKEEGRMR
jgi:hypothetical protein